LDAIPNVDIEFMKQIAERANSDLLLFFIILAVAIVPVLYVLQRGNASQAKQNAEREQNIIEVIKSNTEAMCGVRASIDVLAATMTEAEADGR
jgi:membrane-anchored glycerophosphoryl diester phosphodiesterase (GDPDase)